MPAVNALNTNTCIVGVGGAVTPYGGASFGFPRFGGPSTNLILERYLSVLNVPSIDVKLYNLSLLHVEF